MMFWQTPLLLLGVLGAVCKAAPVLPLEGDVTGLTPPENFTLDSLDVRSLDERFTVTYVFRADKRSPSEIKKAGGFMPKGYTSKTAIKEDVSLYRHVKGASDGFSMDNDGYVSTTSSQTVAEGWIVKYLGGTGYTYKIATYANLIDCQKTLKKYNKFPQEKEFAALKVIPWQQVIGWAQFSSTKHGVVKGTPTGNKDYNAGKYDGEPHGGAQYALAGFPRDHPAWKEDPWYYYTACKNVARATEIFARGRSRTSSRTKTSHATRKHKATTHKKKTPKKTTHKKATPKKTTHKKTPPKKATTKCTAAMKKAGKCKTTKTTKCTAAMKKAGKCGKTTKCSAADKKAGKCCSATDKKAGKCKQQQNQSCGPIQTNKQAAQEYWKELQTGKTPKSGSHPKTHPKITGTTGTKSSKKVGA